MYWKIQTNLFTIKGSNIVISCTEENFNFNIIFSSFFLNFEFLMYPKLGKAIWNNKSVRIIWSELIHLLLSTQLHSQNSPCPDWHSLIKIKTYDIWKYQFPLLILAIKSNKLMANLMENDMKHFLNIWYLFDNLNFHNVQQWWHS